MHSGLYKGGGRFLFDIAYRKVASYNMSHLEAHAGFFRLLMKGIFDPYVPYVSFGPLQVLSKICELYNWYFQPNSKYTTFVKGWKYQLFCYFSRNLLQKLLNLDIVFASSFASSVQCAIPSNIHR